MTGKRLLAFYGTVVACLSITLQVVTILWAVWLCFHVVLVREVIREIGQSPLLRWLTVALFLSSSISTFDMRLAQAKRRGELPADEPNLPDWVHLFHLLDWLILAVLLVLNWKAGLSVSAFLVPLKVLPGLGDDRKRSNGPIQATIGYFEGARYNS